MIGYTNGKITIGVEKPEGNKKPSLTFKQKNVTTRCGTFTNMETARAFMDAMAILLNTEKVDAKEWE